MISIRQIVLGILVLWIMVAALAVCRPGSFRTDAGLPEDGGPDAKADSGLSPYIHTHGMNVPRECFTPLPNGATIERDGAILDETLRVIGQMPPQCSFLASKKKGGPGTPEPLKWVTGFNNAQWAMLWQPGTGCAIEGLPDGGILFSGPCWWATQYIGHFTTPNVPINLGGQGMTFWPGLTTNGQYTEVIQPVFEVYGVDPSKWYNNYIWCCDFSASLPGAPVAPGTVFMWGFWIDSRFPCDSTGLNCHVLGAAEYGNADASAFQFTYGSFQLPINTILGGYINAMVWEVRGTFPCATSGNNCASYPYSGTGDGGVGSFTFTIDSIYEIYDPNDGAPHVPVFLSDGGTPTTIPVYPPFPDPNIYDGNVPSIAQAQTSSGIVLSYYQDAGMCNCQGDGSWDGNTFTYTWHP